MSKSPSALGLKPSDLRILNISSVGTVIPSTLLTLSIDTCNSLGSIEFPLLTSSCVDETLPQPSSSIR